MPKHRNLRRVLLGTAAVGVSAWLGYLWGQTRSGLELWCSGQMVQRFMEPTIHAERWLLSRYSLDLGADLRGHFRLNSQLLDEKNQVVGQLDRLAAFDYQQADDRLMLQVTQASKSENDSLAPHQLPDVSLAAFNTGAALGFRLRRLSMDTYLIDNGIGQQLLCQLPNRATDTQAQ